MSQDYIIHEALISSYLGVSRKTLILLSVLFTGFLGILIYPLSIKGFVFPDFGILAWIYLVPLLVAARFLRMRQAFFMALAASAIFYTGILYWLVIAMKNYGEIPLLGSVGILLALVAILSLYFAFFFFVASWIVRFTRFAAFLVYPTVLSLGYFFLSYFPFGGFPWVMPAYTQSHYLFFFQWLDVTGVHGLNFFIIIINTLIAEILVSFLAKRQNDKILNRVILLGMLVLGSYLASIFEQKMEERTLNTDEFLVSLIQGNISQSIKWESSKARENTNTYLELTQKAADQGAKLVVWPETAFPYPIDLNDIEVTELFDKGRIPLPLLIGAVSQKGEDKFYNSAILVSEAGKLKGIYHKNHLVPFAEYNPLSFLPLVDKITGGFVSLTPGNKSSPLILDRFKFGILICYEDLFPNEARKAVKSGANVLVNLTNDAWYENSSALYQHLVLSQFRALETRRYLLRVTNTGVTAFIDSRGMITRRADVLKPEVLLGSITPKKRITLYTMVGDVIGWFYLGLTLFFSFRAYKKWKEGK